MYNFQMWKSMILTSCYYEEPEVMAFVWSECDGKGTEQIWKVLICGRSTGCRRSSVWKARWHAAQGQLQRPLVPARAHWRYFLCFSSLRLSFWIFKAAGLHQCKSALVPQNFQHNLSLWHFVSLLFSLLPNRPFIKETSTYIRFHCISKQLIWKCIAKKKKIKLASS